KTEGLVKRKIRMRICLGTTRVRESELQKEVAQFKSWGCGIAAKGSLEWPQQQPKPYSPDFLSPFPVNLEYTPRRVRTQCSRTAKAKGALILLSCASMPPRAEPL
ncbi:MAG: hypothetical protein ACLQVM_16045, partial [Terriglobia bacterium]